MPSFSRSVRRRTTRVRIALESGSATERTAVDAEASVPCTAWDQSSVVDITPEPEKKRRRA
jgi:hypothetical protein